MSDRGSTATILFTDLVNSTELMQRVGDEQAQRMFEAHHKLLRDALGTTGGEELQWLGDGLMASFSSAADAVRCAVAIQQGARRPVGGHRLEVRIGLNTGEVIRQDSGGGQFGTPVVIASRICALAGAGQILCSGVVAALLSSRQAFTFRELAARTLKGIAAPVALAELVYQSDDPRIILARPPFVGRDQQLDLMGERLHDVRAAGGGIVMLAGEPGIGKTRIAEEFAERARSEGCTVLWGRCYEGESPPFNAFVEALADFVRSAEAAELRADLGFAAAPLSRLVSVIRARLPDTPEPAPLSPEEERFRLFDAVSQFVIAISARKPVVVVLDDVHWADKGTIAMLLHLARFVARNRILIVGAYRDVELDRQHPLADALPTLRREPRYQRIALKGLSEGEVHSLLEALAGQEASAALTRALTAETEGNPFFIRETLLHLIEERKIFREGGRWTSRSTIAEMGIPEGVREVIGRRLRRLSDKANVLLAAASGFNGGFQFSLTARVAELGEGEALAALDEALNAQLVRALARADAYEFTHALIRHTLYGEMNPSRQVRLHRRIAEAMEAAFGADAKQRAGEIAYQYHRSAAIAGAERGVGHAITAANQAEAASANEQAGEFLRIALDLLPAADARRGSLLARLATALALASNPDEAVKVATEAAKLLAASDGDQSAASFLADMFMPMQAVAAYRHIGDLGDLGLFYKRGVVDRVWGTLKFMQIAGLEARAGSDRHSAISERNELRRALKAIPVAQFNFGWGMAESRAEVLQRLKDSPNGLVRIAGEIRAAVPLLQDAIAQSDKNGQLFISFSYRSSLGRCFTAQGDLRQAAEILATLIELRERIPPAFALLNIATLEDDLRLARGEGWQQPLENEQMQLAQAGAAFYWVVPLARAAFARNLAHLGRAEDALSLLEMVLPEMGGEDGSWVDHARIPSDTADTLWQLNRRDHLEVVERDLREQVIPRDLRAPMHDARLALARLCALKGDHAEASEWFAKAREVLAEQGARPLRAIVDFDEAWMYLRRSASGDAERARQLLDAAIRQFEEIGMTGWLRRAHDLLRSPGHG